MMKILYVGGFELPDKGAAAVRVMNNAKLFSSLGFDVVFCGVYKTDNKGIVKRTFNGYTTISIKYPQSIKEWFYYLVHFFSFRIIESYDPDIVITYDFPGIALLKWKRYCRKRKIKMVGDVTEWYIPTGNIVTKSLRYVDTSIRMRYAHKKLDGMITISRYLYNYYSKQRRVLLPPLHDDIKKYINREKQDEKIIITYAGTGGINKDRIDSVIKALHSFKDNPFLFNVVGLTKEQYENMYNHKIEIPNNIVFHGRLSHAETLKILSRSDFQIFIRPQNIVTTAGFPSKLAESFYLGIPVITNRTSNIEEFLHNGKNGFLLESGEEMDIRSTLLYISGLNKCEILRIKETTRVDMSFAISSYKTSVRCFFKELFEN